MRITKRSIERALLDAFFVAWDSMDEAWAEKYLGKKYSYVSKDIPKKYKNPTQKELIESLEKDGLYKNGQFTIKIEPIK